MLLLIIVYKIIGAIISILCDFVYTSIGFESFAWLYWCVLSQYDTLAGGIGKIINVIEHDCNLTSNVVYSLLTTLFY
ncbi:MAG: hypothetical protein KDD45_13490, partial [Bdellovibrionales bacterium]|nr:hypothetical protein [Bdellovibrionales bacterium]